MEVQFGQGWATDIHESHAMSVAGEMTFCRLRGKHTAFGQHMGGLRLDCTPLRYGDPNLDRLKRLQEGKRPATKQPLGRPVPVRAVTVEEATLGRRKGCRRRCSRGRSCGRTAANDVAPNNHKSQ
jgi:hypothetical protein